MEAGPENIWMASAGRLKMDDSLTQRFPAAQVAVTLVNTSALLRQFVDVPYRIYHRDPHWVTPVLRF
jgi:hypothetical protein